MSESINNKEHEKDVVGLKRSKEFDEDLEDADGLSGDDGENPRADSPNSKNRATSFASNIRASPLKRTDFTALEVI